MKARVKFQMKPTIGIFLAASLLSFACSRNSDSSSPSASPGPLKPTVDDKLKTKIDVAAIKADTKLNPVERAEKLALAAEQLLSAQGFVYADSIADLSLKEDPTNLRAQFVKAILAPIIPQQGLVSRLQPISEMNPRLKERYDRLVLKMNEKLPASTARSFLLEGAADIKTEADLQTLLDKVSAGFKSLRSFAKDNKDKELSVTVSDILVEPLLGRLKNACHIAEVSPGEFELECPKEMSTLQVTLSHADFEALQEAAAAGEVSLALSASYDLAGTMDVAKNHVDDEPASINAKEIVEQVLSNAKFGTLRAGQIGFQKLKEMGADAVLGARWIMANQSNVCKLGHTDPLNRVGQLLDEGLCENMVPQRNMILANTEKAIAGQTISVGLYNVTVSPNAWMAASPVNLHAFTPLTFDACHNVVGAADPSLGGLLPNGDLNVILKRSATCAP